MCRKESAAGMSDVWVEYYWGSLNTSGDNHNHTLLPEIVNCVGGLKTCLSPVLLVSEYVSSMPSFPCSLSCISKAMSQRLSHIVIPGSVSYSFIPILFQLPVFAS